VSQKRPETIRILLVRLGDRQLSLVQQSLEQARISNGADGPRVVFELDRVLGKGIEVLRQAAHADVVLFGLGEGMAGEISHIQTEYPEVKIIVVDKEADVRMVLGAGTEPLSRDLLTVIRWITHRSDDLISVHSRAR
jgi:hypothetical protein